MFSLALFYTFFYIFTRFKAAHNFKEEDQRENTLNWFMIVPFIFEMFVFAWIFFDVIDPIDKNIDE